jgi:hypothetical protein
MEPIQPITCTVERGQRAGDAGIVHIQVQWVPFFDEVRVLGRVGYDLDSESADFHFAWNAGSEMLIVYPPYRWLMKEEEAIAYRNSFECVNEASQQQLYGGAVPYYRFPHTKDGTTLIEILEVLFEGHGGVPQRIVLL